MLDLKGMKNTFIGPISFTVASGQCAAISGPSGAGKSLLLRMIADLDPHEGDVALGTVNRAAIPAPAWRHKVVYVPAEPGWWADRVDAHFEPTRIARAKAIAARLSLDPVIFDRLVRNLSTGEKQRLGLTRAIVAAPDVLLLDEPTSALDPTATAQVEALLDEQRAAGTILVLVTHDRAQADRLGDQLYTMTKAGLTRR